MSLQKTKIGCGIEMNRNLSLRLRQNEYLGTALRKAAGAKSEGCRTEVRRYKCALRFLGGFAAAAAARGRLSGSFADELGGPHGSDKALYAVIVKIDRGAIGV
jgi:hypothetical protein